MTARVKASSAAKWKYVKRTCFGRSWGHSDGWGSLTLTTRSARSGRWSVVGGRWSVGEGRRCDRAPEGRQTVAHGDSRGDGANLSEEGSPGGAEDRSRPARRAFFRPSGAR